MSADRVTIRPEQERDFARIDEILRQAFEIHPYSKQNEHQLVTALREAGALSVALVAESGGTVIGHIAFSKVTVDGEDVSWHGLAPVAVAPEAQRQGVGSKLVLAGLDAIRQLGATGCVLVGEPGYYGRFGFKAMDSLRLEGVPPEVFLALPFTENIPSGTVAFDKVFDRYI